MSKLADIKALESVLVQKETDYEQLLVMSHDANSSKEAAKVELDAVYDAGDIDVTVNGKPYAEVFGQEAEFVADEKGKNDESLGSALILRDLALADAGEPRRIVQDELERRRGPGCLGYGWHLPKKGGELRVLQRARQRRA